jgi:hypothetical protein
MYDTQMNRIASRVTSGRDYSDRPTPRMTPCPKGGSADTGPTFAFPAPRKRGWFRR